MLHPLQGLSKSLRSVVSSISRSGFTNGCPLEGISLRGIHPNDAPDNDLHIVQR